jgi:hypothetical protein
MPTEHEVEECMGGQQIPENVVSAASLAAAELIHGGAS